MQATRPGGDWARYAAVPPFDPRTGEPVGWRPPGPPPEDELPGFDPRTGQVVPGPTNRPCLRWEIWEEWRTVQDGRVCSICAPRHGRWFQRGEGPRTPAHYGCRCVRVEVWSECRSRAPAPVVVPDSPATRPTPGRPRGDGQVTF